MINNHHVQINAFNNLPKSIDEQILTDLVQNSYSEIIYFPDDKKFVLTNQYNFKKNFNYHITINKKALEQAHNIETYILEKFSEIATNFYDKNLSKHNQQDIDHKIYLSINNSNYRLSLFTNKQIEHFIAHSNYPVNLFNNVDQKILAQLDHTAFIYSLASSNSDSLKRNILRKIFHAQTITMPSDNEYMTIHFENQSDKKKFIKYFTNFKNNLNGVYNNLFLIHTQNDLILTRNDTYFNYLSYVYAEFNDNSGYKDTFLDQVELKQLIPKQFKKIIINFIGLFFIISFYFMVIYGVSQLLAPLFSTLTKTIIMTILFSLFSIVMIVLVYIILFYTLLNIATLLLFKDYDNHFKTHRFEKFSRMFLITTNKNKFFNTYHILPFGISNLDNGLTRVTTETTLLKGMLSMIYYGYQL